MVNGVSYLVSPTAFFQTNVGAAAAIVKIVLEEIDQPKGLSPHVLDLYCGTGLFALQLAQAGARVTAVEENREAIKDAEANARLNRIPDGRLRFIAGRVEDELARISSRVRPDTVVLDPARPNGPGISCGDFSACALFYVPLNKSTASCMPWFK